MKIGTCSVEPRQAPGRSPTPPGPEVGPFIVGPKKGREDSGNPRRRARQTQPRLRRCGIMLTIDSCERGVTPPLVRIGSVHPFRGRPAPSTDSSGIKPLAPKLSRLSRLSGLRRARSGLQPSIRTQMHINRCKQRTLPTNAAVPLGMLPLSCTTLDGPTCDGYCLPGRSSCSRSSYVREVDYRPFMVHAHARSGLRARSCQWAGIAWSVSGSRVAKP